MPRYKFSCDNCGEVEIMTLPISTDPNTTYECHTCWKGRLVRKIIGASAFKRGRQTLGKWFKSETGKDFMPGGD